MKISVQKGVLQGLIQNVANVVPTKTTLQILSNIYFSAKAGKLMLQATDLDISISSHVSTDIDEEGEFLVNAGKLREIIKELPEVVLDLVSTKNHLEISYGKTFSCKFPVIDVSEFPQMPKLKSDQGIKINSKIIEQMVENAAFAVSADETRRSLRGVCWELDKNEFRMVATDGHRLGYCCRTDLEDVKIAKKKVIVSPKALHQLTHILADGDEKIEINFGDVAIAFKGENFVLYSKLIEGVYPNYQQVIPKGNKNILVVEKDAIMAALKRVSILSHAKTRQVRFKFSKAQLKLTAVNRDWGGEAEENLDVDYNGQDLDIGFNAQYFLEMIKLCPGEKITVTLGTPLSACTLVPDAGSKVQDTLFLLMPLRLMEDKNETA